MKEKFKYELDLRKGNQIIAPKGFVAEDLREYREAGIEVIGEMLDNAWKDYQKSRCFVQNPKTKEKVFGASTGDIMVEIQDNKEEVTILVYRLIRAWEKEKKRGANEK